MPRSGAVYAEERSKRRRWRMVFDVITEATADRLGESPARIAWLADQATQTRTQGDEREHAAGVHHVQVRRLHVVRQQAQHEPRGSTQVKLQSETGRGLWHTKHKKGGGMGVDQAGERVK
jgi:hypothetical protein